MPFLRIYEQRRLMNAIEVRLRFIKGFRLGAKIMLDVLTCPELEGEDEC